MSGVPEKQSLPWTGERYVPGVEGQIALEHLHRYAVACELASEKVVLDIACGEGYGAGMLAQTAQNVVGVDISSEAIKHASAKYPQNNLRFIVGSCAAIPFADNSFDLVVSFETIEHHEQHTEMFMEIKRVLKPDGLMLMSSPDKYEYSVVPKVTNTFHVKELYRHEFESLIARFYKNFVLYGQRIMYGSGILSETHAGSSVTFNKEKSSYHRVPGLARPQYLLALASDRPLPEFPNSIFEQPLKESELAMAYSQIVSERNEEIARLEQGLAERNEELENFRIRNHELAAWALSLNHELEEARAVYTRLSEDYQKRTEWALSLNRELTELYQSWFWHMTHPLNTVYRFLKKIGIIPSGSRKILGQFFYRNFRKLPFSIRARIKEFVQRTSIGYSAIRWIKALSQGLPVQSEMWPPPAHISILPVDLSQEILFELENTPLVSIVIPVYNNVEYTHRCLKSIQDSAPQKSFEVIIVDDQSQDQTASIVSSIKGIRVITNESNVGFIKSCNKGATEARGKFLLFLNNDTQVLPGWLDELVETFEGNPDAGLVGAKLLNSNGTLQEAGGIIWNDGSAWNYGRNEDPRKPEYSYLREVDYCSGACIMVPRELFFCVGGFDEWYAPAYGEDSDLAFQIKKGGRKVYYQPMAEIIHFEGVSSGTDLTRGVKSYQVANGQKLFQRWRPVLAHHRSPGDSPWLERERNISKRILVVDACTPTPDQDAGSLKIFNFIHIFQSLSFKVTFVPDNLAFVKDYTSALQRKGVECLYWPYVKSLDNYLERFGRNFDFILTCRPNETEKYLKSYRRHCPQAKIIYDTGDLHYIREHRQAEIEGSSVLAKAAEQRKSQELSIVSKVDCTLVVSEAERQILLKEVSAAKVVVISAVHDVTKEPASLESRKGLFFLGGYQHTPNVDAVHYFVKDIFPLVRKQIPGIQFFIIGSQVPDSLHKLACEDIILAGYVQELSEYLKHLRVAVNPLRYGAGIKGKIVTSMANGVPCVGTSLAFEGMDLEDGKDVLIADTPEQFSQAIVSLYCGEDLWRSFSQRGIEIVQERYSFQTAQRGFESLLSDHRVLPRPSATTLPGYVKRIEKEIQNYQHVENVHDLPPIFHYWSNKYLLPKFQSLGISGVTEFFLEYVQRACHAIPEGTARVASLGAGNCDTEVEMAQKLLALNTRNFIIDCVDINPYMLQRGRDLAYNKKVGDYLRFLQTDIQDWSVGGQYDVVVANQSLHHFQELEVLFEKTLLALKEDGVFVISDVIGRNGHMRWPEALEYLNEIWSRMPDRYKYNHLLGRFEGKYENWDCSVEGFEGIRAQDILPLLLKSFNFEVFLSYGNLTDIFIDRAFGHNFDAHSEVDRQFIDEVAELDEQLIENGQIKPTHVMAVMRKNFLEKPRCYKHLTPEFCVRDPGST